MKQPGPDYRMIGHIGAALVAVAAAFPTIVNAQPAAYPARLVRVVVPFPAGGPIDVPARLVAQRLAEMLGQQFVVENRAGASGRIGTEFVARAPRDGYTLLFTHSGHTSNVSQFKKLPYDTVADFAPITQVNSTSGNLLVVHPSVPARTVQELIALARSRPGELNYASAGIGSPPHVGAALFAATAGIQLTHVPYKSTVAGLTDVLGGRAELIVSSPGFALPFIKERRLRALGATGPRRLTELPDVPAISEAGLPGYVFASWHGMWFPAGVPAEIVRRLHAEVAKALAVPEVRRQFAENYLIPVGSPPEEFAEFIRKDIALQASIVQKIGLEPE